MCKIRIESHREILAIPLTKFPVAEIRVQQTKFCKNLLHGDTVRVCVLRNVHHVSMQVMGRIVEVENSCLSHLKSLRILCRPDPNRLYHMLPLDPRLQKIRVQTEEGFGKPNRVQRLILKDPKSKPNTTPIVNCLNRGQLYVVECQDWPSELWVASGIVHKVLNEKKSKLADNDILELKYGLDTWSDWPESCQQEIKQICHHPSRSDMTIRKDLTELLCFTIDHTTAQDLDDAFSLTAVEEDSFFVGVHISDVSGELEQGGPLDVEAFERSESYYTSEGRQWSMLPELVASKLSL